MGRAYLDVAAELRRRIESGAYGQQMALPSERALVDEFNIHRATVRRALTLLAQQGLVKRAPGQRAFIEGRARSREANIGLFAAAPSDPFARSLIANGVSDLLREEQSDLHLIWSNYHRFELGAAPEDEDDLDIPTDRFAALLIWPPKCVDVDRLIQVRAAMPVVMLDRRAPGFESDFVGFRDIEAGYEAAKHLYEVGHRKLAFVGETIYETSLNRRFGFQKFCEEAGIEACWRWAGFEYATELPKQVQSAWMSLPKGDWPTAAVCTNDETAARVISLLATAGMRSPEDLGLIGFGGAQPALLSAIGLTTMEQPFTAVGHAAAEIVLERIDGCGDKGYKDVRLPMKLRVRSSCGAKVPAYA